MSERARALEQAQSGANVLTRCQCGGNLRWGQMVSAGVYAIYCDACTAPAVDPPPSGASPQATGGYIHHSLTDWIPTPECDCDRCTSARKSARKPTGGASPQAETRRDCTCLGTCRGAEGLGPRWKCALETPGPVSPVEPPSEDEDDDVPLLAPEGAMDSWSAPLRKPVPLKILSTDDFYALLRILEVLPIADPFLTDLQSKLSDEHRRQHGNRASHLSGPEFVHEIDRIEALIQSRLPAPVSPVEPTPEPPTDQLRETPMGHRIFRHVCGTPEDDGECMACSQIDCPDGEPLHYHHDGCPCCSQKPTVEPEPPTLEPCAHELDYHNCAECVGPKVEPEPCVWREDEDGIWETSCGASWVFTDGSPSENNTKFCHNCGHPVQPVAYVERFEDDEDEAGAPLKVEREQSDEQPSEISAVPHKPVVNLMEALKKSLESLDRARKP